MSLSLGELDDHLFKCADIIRNTVDKTDYKDYILPLVFYKTISDTYDDQYEQRLEEYGDEEIAKRPAFYDFVVPEEYAWEELRAQNKNVDQFINEAFDALSEANEGKLEGVLRADFVAADALDDQKLTTLVEHLSTYNLSIERVPPDLLGEAYMDLVRHFASEEGRDGGEFFTPPHIVELMVRLLEPFEDGDTFHDPTCGSGGMLVEAARHYREVQGGDPSKLTFTGQEINPDIYAIAKINLFVHGLNGDIQRGDSLGDPKFEDNGELDTFDYVLANFPFSADWPKDDLQDDPWNRFGWADKLPRADRGDYAFIMHMAEQLNDTGQAAIVVPHGVLFRKHESKYRKPMIDNDLVEAVIGLPKNLFQNNSIPTAILLLNQDKSEERTDEVQFIHAADEGFYREESNQNILTPEGINKIVENFNDWTNEERVSRAVSAEEIRENDYNLNIALYVDTTEPEEELNVAEELATLRELQAERKEIEARMTQHMGALNYE
ncbi:Type I restriction-modification system methyltransferase subunit [Halalkaliarchaeum sp. AArc-CO]|uniref:type I restriction-modification system subunit M n=1 Tax=Halalkaliarchaeum sp. AArc-CO TaxID=2866381 RepID=UPI00217E8D49|nr:class I SAM-dependent DNA methyltransferase [Halalkaliarchaeum sp. AArc-CO]UWG50713.1 Type I restriction-modification system methyltransferase subunit [Halalkaliarchaeum sp. AArc-CO]